MKEKIEKAQYVCSTCGELHGTWRDGVETWHQGKCDVCGKDEFLCHVRRYSWLRKKE